MTSARRVHNLVGLTVGLLDIPSLASVFLDRLEKRLIDIGARVKDSKAHLRKPAVDLRHEIATTCNVVIEALAD